MENRNPLIEEAFVHAFVRPERRDRALFELASPKKRGHFFNKLSHRFKTILDERFMHAIPAPNSCADDICKMLKAEGAPQTSYVMSSKSDFDAQDSTLADALRNTVGMGLPSIVSCIPGKLAYFEAEQEMGPPPRFILKRSA